MVSATDGVGTDTGGGTGSDLGSGTGGAGAGAGDDSAIDSGAGAGVVSTAGSGHPLAVSRKSSSFVSSTAAAVGSSSQLGSWTVAGFSHSVEDGSSAGSGTGRDGSSTDEVDGGAAACVGTCCTGGGGGIGFGAGLK